MKWLVAVVALCALAPGARCASGSDWCYVGKDCDSTQWPKLSPQYCNGTRQSPININTEAVTGNENLTAFTFTNFDSAAHLKSIENTGRTVKVNFNSGIQVTGGDLPEAYNGLQFHLHWGNGASAPGSEHTVNGVRHPMELHIVNLRSSLNMNVTLALADPQGLAALGFFIDVEENTTDEPAGWKKLTDYLTSIPDATNSVNISGISLNDLLVGVNTTKYYRYLGSLTTPTCNEAVIWTVFKESVKVSKNLIDRFSNTVYVTNSSASVLMVDVYRHLMPDQKVQTQSATSTPSTSSSSSVTFSLWMIFLSVLLCKC